MSVIPLPRDQWILECAQLMVDKRVGSTATAPTEAIIKWARALAVAYYDEDKTISPAKAIADSLADI